MAATNKNEQNTAEPRGLEKGTAGPSSPKKGTTITFQDRNFPSMLGNSALPKSTPRRSDLLPRCLPSSSPLKITGKRRASDSEPDEAFLSSKRLCSADRVSSFEPICNSADTDEKAGGTPQVGAPEPRSTIPESGSRPSVDIIPAVPKSPAISVEDRMANELVETFLALEHDDWFNPSGIKFDAHGHFYFSRGWDDASDPRNPWMFLGYPEQDGDMHDIGDQGKSSHASGDTEKPINGALSNNEDSAEASGTAAMHQAYPRDLWDEVCGGLGSPLEEALNSFFEDDVALDQASAQQTTLGNEYISSSRSSVSANPPAHAPAERVPSPAPAINVHMPQENMETVEPNIDTEGSSSDKGQQATGPLAFRYTEAQRSAIWELVSRGKYLFAQRLFPKQQLYRRIDGIAEVAAYVAEHPKLQAHLARHPKKNGKPREKLYVCQSTAKWNTSGCVTYSRDRCGWGLDTEDSYNRHVATVHLTKKRE